MGHCLYGVLAGIGLLVLGLGILAALLSRGSLSADVLRPAIQDALERHVGGGYRFGLGALSLARSQDGLALTIDQLNVTTAHGQTIVAAPRAEISLDPWALAFASIQPTRLEVYDVTVKLVVQESGEISVSAGRDAVIVAAPKPASTAPAGEAAPAGPLVAQPPAAVAAAAVRGLIDLVSSSESPLAALQHMGVARGELVFEDQRTQQKTTFQGLSLDFDKDVDGVRLDVSAKGPSGRWNIAARTIGAPDQVRQLDLRMSDVSLDEVMLAAQLRNLPFDFDMPISAHVVLTIDQLGKISGASGKFALGAGFLTTIDPDFEPLRFDEATGEMIYNPAVGQIILRDIQYDSGSTRLGASGTIYLPATLGEPWPFDLQTKPDGIFGKDRPGDAIVAMTSGHIAGQVNVATQTLVFEHFDLGGPDLSLVASGEVGWGTADHLSVRARVARTSGRTVLRMWPTPVAPPVRSWLTDHLSAGMLERGTIALDFTGDDLANIRRELGPVDAHSSIDLVLSGATLAVIPGVPPLSGVEMTGHVSGRTVNLAVTRGLIDAGGGRRLTILDGNFSIPDTDPKPTPATINAHLSGTLESLADVLNRDALKSFVNLPIDTTTIHGQAEGRLSVDINLSPSVRPEDTQIRATANVSNFVVDRLVGKEKLDQATLQVNFDRGALKAVGQGRLFGAPASVELQRQAGAVTMATISMSLDDAARAKQGYAFGSALTGPVGARMVSALGQSDKINADVELDFTKASINGLFPGVEKPAGRPAKATFNVSMETDGASLDTIVFDAGATQVRGTLSLDAGGALSEAHLSQVRLSPGDDVKVDAEQSRDGLKIVIRGRSLDARPFLKDLFAGEGGNGRDATGTKDIDFDLKSPLVTGNNKQVVSNLDLHLVRKGGVFRQFQFSGKLGRDALTGSLSRPRDGSPPNISVITQDAGSFLSFLDLYKRMEGGKLAMSMRLGDNGVAGNLNVRDFVLRDEPALRRLVAESVPARDDHSGTASKIDTAAARFTKMQVEFQRVDGRIDVRNGSIFGQQIGLTLDGSVDFPRDIVNLSGTFVPAYGVNNLFSQIPVFGLLLGGGQHEGLFGVNFRINGPASAPVLSVNALSAIAPGFLRKIFGAVETGGTTTAPPPMLSMPQSTGQPLSITPHAN